MPFWRKPCFFPDQSAVEGGERGLRAGKRLDETGGKRTGAVPATAFSNLTNSPIRKPLPAAEVRRVLRVVKKKRREHCCGFGSSRIRIDFVRLIPDQGGQKLQTKKKWRNFIFELYFRCVSFWLSSEAELNVNVSNFACPVFAVSVNVCP